MKTKPATACDQRSPPNIGKGGKKSRRQPSAEGELRKWTGISVPTDWNGKSVIPRRVIRLFRKISGRTTRFIYIQTGRTGNFAYMESTLVCSSYYTQPHPITVYKFKYTFHTAFGAWYVNSCQFLGRMRAWKLTHFRSGFKHLRLNRK